MKTQKEITTFELLSLILVGGISLVNVVMRIAMGWNYSFIVSLIGILYCIFFLLNKRKLYNPLILVWALAQTIEIKYATRTFVFDLDQVGSFGFNFSFNTNTSVTQVGVGFPGIAYTILAILVKMDSIRGMIFTLKSLKKDSILTEFLPADVMIIKRLTIGDEKSWFLVKLVNSSPDKYLLIQGKEEQMIRSGKNQIVHCYKADDAEWLKGAHSVDKTVLKSGGWAVVM